MSAPVQELPNATPGSLRAQQLPNAKPGAIAATPIGFGTGTQPPQPLAAAILEAAQKYGVPADLLAGIWRVESASTYPNPAVNSSGYGGLFGTTDWNGTPQAQADLAASILANGLRASNGEVAGALSYYNSGKTTGGYTTVPGQTTFGKVGVPSTSGGGSIVGTIAHDAGVVAGAVTNPVGTVVGAVTGAISSLNPVTAAENAVGGELGNVASGFETWAQTTATTALLYVVLTFGAFALILLGLDRLSGNRISGAVKTVGKTAGEVGATAASAGAAA